MEITIVPIIKNKCGNLADSINYRPIAIATILYKLFESIVLYNFEEFLYTCDNNQFGFKPKHSTELCIYTLKEFIDYNKRSTTAFVTFLDASYCKAVDKINY